MSGWQTSPQAAVKPLSTLAQSALNHYGNEAAVLAAWRAASDALEKAKALETQLRTALVEIKFPNIAEGTNRVELFEGWSLKATHPYRYDISNKESKAEVAIDKMAEVSQKAGFIADRLIKWNPELSIKEYRLLEAAAATDEDSKKVLELLQPILTIKPGMPQLAIEGPKGK